MLSFALKCNAWIKISYSLFISIDVELNKAGQGVEQKRKYDI